MAIHLTYRARAARRGAAISGAVGLALLANGQPAQAEDIRVDGGRCASEVHVVAREAHLSAILKRLAQTLGFQLSFESENDPLVSIDTARQPNDLVVHLAPSENVSMTQGREPRCPDRERILQVWVLPKGPPTQVVTLAAPTPPVPPPQPTAEQARLAQEGIDLVLRAHGVDPATQAPVN